MSTRLSLFSVSFIAALSLSACDAVSNSSDKGADSAEASATPQTAPLTADGAATPLTVAESSRTDDGLQWAASVVKSDDIPGQSAKLFGVGGGDPAMNGLQTYIAFFQSPGDGWAVYQIGDRHRKIIVKWTQGANDAAPTAVTVTPGE